MRFHVENGILPLDFVPSRLTLETSPSFHECQDRILKEWITGCPVAFPHLTALISQGIVLTSLTSRHGGR
jgi:hypothetical protein